MLLLAVLSEEDLKEIALLRVILNSFGTKAVSWV